MTLTKESANVHPSEDLLRSFVDGAVSPAELIPHLKSCEPCRARVKDMRTFDAAVKSALTERAVASTASQVLSRLGVRERESFVFKSVQWLAPALAFSIVGGVMYFVFRVSGALNTPEAQSSASAANSILNGIGNASNLFALNLSNWLNEYASFAFAQSTFGLAVFFVAFLAGVALIDKFVFVPWFRNRRLG